MKRYILLLSTLAVLSACRHSRVVQSLPGPENPVAGIPMPVDTLRLYEIETDDHPPMRESDEGDIRKLMLLRSAIPDTQTITIPCVFHVIGNGDPKTLISMAQVMSEINKMNMAFGGYGPWGNKSVNTHIQFALAKRDPNGNPSDGVIYVDGTGVPGYKENGIRKSGSTIGATEDAVKRLSYWDYRKYLNIFVVSEISGNNAGSGVIGFAYLPNTAGTFRDGIVVQHTAVGCRDLDNDGIYDADKMGFTSIWSFRHTCTHEAGHALGLYHVFQFTANCANETDCNTQGDRVCDTGPCRQKTNCITDQQCPQVDPPDESFMAYTNAYCQWLFTFLQGKRMRASFEGGRAGWVTSDGLNAPKQMDASVQVIMNSTTCKNSTPIEIQVNNLGLQKIGTVEFSNLGIYQVSIEPGASVRIPVGIMPLPDMGTYPYTAILLKINGQPDTYTQNNQSTASVQKITGKDIRVEVKPKRYNGSETSWIIEDADGNTKMSKTFTNSNAPALDVTTDCLAPGKYKWILNDDYGGMGFESNYSTNWATYKLVVNGTTIVNITSCPCASCTNRSCKTREYEFTVPE